MSAGENQIDVAALSRRIGIKGGDKTWPLVPAIFPSVSIGEFGDLASRPKQARGLGVYNALIPIATRAHWRFGGPNPMIVYRMWMNSSLSTGRNWQIRISEGRVIPSIGVVNVGELPCQNWVHFQLPSPGPFGDTFQFNEMLWEALRWFIPGGWQLEVTCNANPTSGSYDMVGIEFLELTAPPIEA